MDWNGLGVVFICRVSGVGRRGWGVFEERCKDGWEGEKDQC